MEHEAGHGEATSARAAVPEPPHRPAGGSDSAPKAIPFQVTDSTHSWRRLRAQVTASDAAHNQRPLHRAAGCTIGSSTVATTDAADSRPTGSIR